MPDVSFLVGFFFLPPPFFFILALWNLTGLISLVDAASSAGPKVQHSTSMGMSRTRSACEEGRCWEVEVWVRGGVKALQGSSLGRRETMSPRWIRGPWWDSLLGKCCRRRVLCTCKWTERRGEKWKERWLKAASDCLDAHLSVPSHPADVSDVLVNVAPPASSVQRLLRRPRRSAKPPQLLYASVAPPTSWWLNCFSMAAPPTRWPTFLATTLFLCVRVLLPTDSFCNSLW